MKSSIGTAVSFLPPGTPSDVCSAWNRAALAATIATKASRLGLGSDLSESQMAGLAQLVRDSEGDRKPRPLSARTRAAIRAALRPPLTAENDPAQVAAAVFAALPDTPLPITADDGRRYYLIAVPAV
ncbi:hypothetical protein [Streptacidiphilus sp. PAMC 29251]